MDDRNNMLLSLFQESCDIGHNIAYIYQNPHRETSHNLTENKYESITKKTISHIDSTNG